MFETLFFNDIKLKGMSINGKSVQVLLNFGFTLIIWIILDLMVLNYNEQINIKLTECIELVNFKISEI